MTSPPALCIFQSEKYLAHDGPAFSVAKRRSGKLLLGVLNLRHKLFRAMALWVGSSELASSAVPTDQE